MIDYDTMYKRIMNENENNSTTKYGVQSDLYDSCSNIRRGTF